MQPQQAGPEGAKQIYQGAIQPRGFPGLPKGWVSEWETFASTDGKLQLFMVSHHPEAWKSHRVLFVLHGMGEHGGRYLHVPHYVQNEVGAVFCLDNRGHGRSEGLRGHAENFDLYVEDAVLAIRRVENQLRKRFGKSEIHVLAHSMGGLIMLRTLFRHPELKLASVTVSAPLLGVKVPLAASKRVAAHLLAHIWGSLQMSSEVDASLLSHDKEVGKAYVSDRLVHRKGTPKMYTQLMASISDTLSRDSGIEVPLQMIVPLQDRIVDSEATLKFFRALKLREKQLKTYPGFYHESLNELGKEQPFEDIRTWIKMHSPTQSN